MMVDKNINRFCELISEINKINKQLDTEKAGFYSGGYSFEEVNAHIINNLVDLQNEFKVLIKEITL